MIQFFRRYFPGLSQRYKLAFKLQKSGGDARSTPIGAAELTFTRIPGTGPSLRGCGPCCWQEGENSKNNQETVSVQHFVEGINFSSEQWTMVHRVCSPNWPLLLGWNLWRNHFFFVQGLPTVGTAKENTSFWLSGKDLSWEPTHFVSNQHAEVRFCRMRSFFPLFWWKGQETFEFDTSHCFQTSLFPKNTSIIYPRVLKYVCVLHTSQQKPSLQSLFQQREDLCFTQHAADIIFDSFCFKENSKNSRSVSGVADKCSSFKKRTTKSRLAKSLPCFFLFHANSRESARFQASNFIFCRKRLFIVVMQKTSSCWRDNVEKKQCQLWKQKKEQRSWWCRQVCTNLWSSTSDNKTRGTKRSCPGNFFVQDSSPQLASKKWVVQCTQTAQGASHLKLQQWQFGIQ